MSEDYENELRYTKFDCIALIGLVAVIIWFLGVVYKLGYDHATRSIHNRIVDEPRYTELVKEKIEAERRVRQLKYEIIVPEVENEH